MVVFVRILACFFTCLAFLGAMLLSSLQFGDGPSFLIGTVVALLFVNLLPLEMAKYRRFGNLVVAIFATFTVFVFAINNELGAVSVMLAYASMAVGILLLPLTVHLVFKPEKLAPAQQVQEDI